MKIYDLFVNNKSIGEIQKLLRGRRKDTNDEVLSRNLNLDFLDESWFVNQEKK